MSVRDVDEGVGVAAQADHDVRGVDTARAVIRVSWNIVLPHAMSGGLVDTCPRIVEGVEVAAHTDHDVQPGREAHGPVEKAFQPLTGRVNELLVHLWVNRTGSNRCRRRCCCCGLTVVVVVRFRVRVLAAVVVGGVVVGLYQASCCEHSFFLVRITPKQFSLQEQHCCW